MYFYDSFCFSKLFRVYFCGKGSGLGWNGNQQRAYAGQLLQKVEQLKNRRICNTPILNVILTAKERAAEAKGIRIQLDVQETNWSRFEDMDITTIFANLLDNAIEACEAVPEQERFIELRVYPYQDFILLSICNSFTGALPPILKDHMAYSGKKGHSGIGLINVRDAVNKNRGTLKLHTEGNKFIAEVVFEL